MKQTTDKTPKALTKKDVVVNSNKHQRKNMRVLYINQWGYRVLVAHFHNASSKTLRYGMIIECPDGSLSTPHYFKKSDFIKEGKTITCFNFLLDCEGDFDKNDIDNIKSKIFDVIKNMPVVADSEKMTIEELHNAHATSGSVECASAKVQGEIVLTNVSGAIRTESLEAQSIEISGSSGSLSIGGANAPVVSMKCTSGAIRVGTIKGKFILKNSSGSVHVNEAYGEGSAKTTSSSVEVGMQKVTGDITLESGSGRVQLSLPSSSFTANISTGSGSIRTNFDEQLNFNKNGNKATGTIGSNPAFTVNCTNTSGSISIEME